MWVTRLGSLAGTSSYEVQSSFDCTKTILPSLFTRVFELAASPWERKSSVPFSRLAPAGFPSAMPPIGTVRGI
ncbi:MAG: hypothetical protein WA110_00685 [Anaerolineaceae bacterium]